MGGLVSCMPWRKRNNLLTGTVDEERMQTAYRRRGRAIKPTISRPIMNRSLIERMSEPNPLNLPLHPLAMWRINPPPVLEPMQDPERQGSPQPGPSCRRSTTNQSAMPNLRAPMQLPVGSDQEMGRARRRRQLDREVNRMRTELSNRHPALRHDIFGESKKMRLEEMEPFNQLGETQLNMLEDLQPAVIKRILSKLDGDDFVRMEATCRDLKQYCEQDEKWRANRARGLFWRRGQCLVMRSPYEETMKTLQQISALKYNLTVGYMCLWGNITDSQVDVIIAVLRENKSRIKKFVFGASGYSENADNEQTELDASTEKLNQLAEAVHATDIIICPNSDCSVETYTTARMSRVIKALHLPTNKPIGYRHLHRMKFATLTCSIQTTPIDCSCVIQLIKEWHKDERDIQFICLSDAADQGVNGEIACQVMSEDINIRGGPLWHTYYQVPETGDFFPLKWADPSTKDHAWIFMHESKAPIYLFFSENKVVLGTIEGFKENKRFLPQTVLQRNVSGDPDFKNDLSERSQYRSRSRQIARLIDHADLFQRDDRIPNRRRRHRAFPRNMDRAMFQEPGNLLPHGPGPRFFARLMAQRIAGDEAERPLVDNEETVAEHGRLQRQPEADEAMPEEPPEPFGEQIRAIWEELLAQEEEEEDAEMAISSYEARGREAGEVGIAPDGEVDIGMADVDLPDDSGIDVDLPTTSGQH